MGALGRRLAHCAALPAPACWPSARTATTGWSAEQDGAGLTAVRVDGWQQGWLLDAAADGPVTETYAPERLYRAGLLVGAVSLVGLLALVLLWRRRPPRARPAPVGTRVLPAWCWAGLTTLSSASSPGGPAPCCARGAPSAYGRWRGPEDAWTLAAGGLVLLAAAYYAFHGWGAADGWGGAALLPQLAVLLALVLAVSSAGRPSPRSRIAGSSTKR